MCFVTILSMLSGNLGHTDFEVRERATAQLSNPLGALYLGIQPASDNPEVRWRAKEILLKRGWWLNAELTERRTFVRDPESWFWLYLWEDRSQMRWTEIQTWFGDDIAHPPEHTKRVRAKIFASNLIPPWWLLNRPLVPKGYTNRNHLVLPWSKADLVHLYWHADFFNQKGQAKRAVIGGMYGTTLP